MSRNGILTHTTLHPHLTQLVAGLVDGHARLVVVHTAQDQVHTLVTTEMPVATVIRHTRSHKMSGCVCESVHKYVHKCVRVCAHAYSVCVCVCVCRCVCVDCCVCALHTCMHDCVLLFMDSYTFTVTHLWKKKPHIKLDVCAYHVCVCVCV